VRKLQRFSRRRICRAARSGANSELAASHRLPAMYPYSMQVADAGGLMAYDINIPDLQRRAAIYVDRILKGANPADFAR
jgi:putative tryptophan/tyrosine transport system substrate-binding protein